MTDYQSILKAKYPHLTHNVDYELHHWPGGPNPAKGGEDDPPHYYLVWRSDEPEPTIEELAAWGKEHQAELLAPHIQEAIAGLQATFYEVAGVITGEPRLDELKIKMWEMRYNLALAWEAAGKPDPAGNPAWALAVNEAKNRTDITDPATLFETWLKKGAAWNGVLATYIPFEAEKRAVIRGAGSIEDIELIKATIEPELRGLFGLE